MVIVSLGQAIWQSPQAIHLLLPFSSTGMISRPRKRGDIFNVARFLGYCSVTLGVKNSRPVTFMPVSNAYRCHEAALLYRNLFLLSSEM